MPLGVDIATWAYWVAAVGASIFAGAIAVKVFIHNKADEGDSGWRWQWRVYQFWLNAVCALVGWIALRVLINRFGSCVVWSDCPNAFGLYDLPPASARSLALPATSLPLSLGQLSRSTI